MTLMTKFHAPRYFPRTVAIVMLLFWILIMIAFNFVYPIQHLKYVRSFYVSSCTF